MPWGEDDETVGVLPGVKPQAKDDAWGADDETVGRVPGFKPQATPEAGFRNILKPLPGMTETQVFGGVGRLKDPSEQPVDENGLTPIQRAVQAAGDIPYQQEAEIHRKTIDAMGGGYAKALMAGYTGGASLLMDDEPEPVKAFGRAAVGGLTDTAAMGAGLLSRGAELTGLAEKGSTQALSDFRKSMNEGAEKASSGMLEDTARGVISSVSKMIPATAVGGQPLAIATFVMDSMNEGYSEAKRKGLNDEEALSYAAREGLIEGVITSAFSLAGAGGAEKLATQAFKGAAKQGIKGVVKNLAPELLEENLTEFGHALNQALSGVDPEAITPERLKETVKSTFAQTIATMGLLEGSKHLGGGQKEGPSRSEFKVWAKENGVEITGKESITQRAEIMQKAEQDAANIQRGRELWDANATGEKAMPIKPGAQAPVEVPPIEPLTAAEGAAGLDAEMRQRWREQGAPPIERSFDENAPVPVSPQEGREALGREFGGPDIQRGPAIEPETPTFAPGEAEAIVAAGVSPDAVLRATGAGTLERLEASAKKNGGVPTLRDFKAYTGLDGGDGPFRRQFMEMARNIRIVQDALVANPNLTRKTIAPMLGVGREQAQQILKAARGEEARAVASPQEAVSPPGETTPESETAPPTVENQQALPPTEQASVEEPAVETTPEAPPQEQRSIENASMRARVELLSPDSRKALLKELEGLPSEDRMARMDALMQRAYEGEKDSATGLPTRKVFERMERENQLGKYKLAMDVIGLGGSNDNLGYTAGDAVLKLVADENTNVGLDTARWGGDELMTHGNDLDALVAQANKLNEFLADKTFEFVDSKGRLRRMMGAHVVFGVGENTSDALNIMEAAKEKARETGVRPQKGQLPGYMVEVDEGGGLRPPERTVPGAGQKRKSSDLPEGRYGGHEPIKGARTPAPEAVKIPFMITKDQRQQLYDLGYSKAEVDAMRPAAGQVLIDKGTQRKRGRVFTEAERQTPGDDIAFKFVDKDGKPTMERADVQRIFPGTYVKDLGNEGYRVIFKNGKYMDVRQVPKITMSDAQWAAAKEAYPDLTDADRSRMQAAGSLEMISGKHKMNGIALMKLAAGYADEATIKHEGLHFAKRAGLFTNEEWAALVDEHSEADKSVEAQEEDIANAREAWTGERQAKAAPSVLQKVQSWARGLLENMGLLDPKAEEEQGLTGEDVHVLMDSAEFWQREMKIDPNGKRFVDIMFTGRPDLANPATSEGARNMVNRAREEYATPESKADAKTFAEANKLLAQPRRREALQKKILAGEMLDGPSTVAARRIIDEAAAKAADTQDRADVEASLALTHGWDKGGRTWGEAGRLRRDWVENPAERRAVAMRRALFGFTDDAYRLVEKAEKEGNTQKVEQIQKQQARKIAAFSKKHGISEEKIIEWSANEDVWSEKMQEIGAGKAGYWDKGVEVWRNWGLLSNPLTHIKNTVANLANAGWDFTGARLSEALVNKVFSRNPKYAQFGEFRHMIDGLSPGVAAGIDNAKRSFRLGMPVHLMEGGQRDLLDIYPRAAIGGTTGEYARLFYKLLGAADSFTATLAAHAQVHAEAYRSAKSKGLTGKALSKHMAEQMSNPMSDSWLAARLKAEKLGFRQEGRMVTKGVKDTLLSWRSIGKGAGVKPFEVVLPFVSTPANVAEAIWEYSPADISTIVTDAALEAKRKVEGLHKDDKTKQYTNDYSVDWDKLKAPDRIARQMVAWTVALALLSYLRRKKEDRYVDITGNMPIGFGSTAEREFRQRQGEGTTLRIGKTTLKYGDADPFATTVSMLADVARLPEDATGADKLEAAVTSLARNLGNKSGLKGASDLLLALTGTSEDRARVLSDVKSTALPVPNAVRAFGRAREDYIPEAKQWGATEEEKTARNSERMWQKTGIPGVGLVPGHRPQPKIDTWGRPAKADSGGPLARILNPFPVRTVDEFVGDQIIQNYNDSLKKGQKPWYPSKPEPTYQAWEGDKKVTKSMTDEQYAEYCKRAGELAREWVQEEQWDVKNPTEEDIKFLKKIISDTRRQARQELIEADFAEEAEEAAG